MPYTSEFSREFHRIEPSAVRIEPSAVRIEPSAEWVWSI